MLTNAPKGTKDMLPEQAYKWHYVEEKFADICRKYGFKEIRKYFRGESATLQMWSRKKCTLSTITPAGA